MALAFSAESEQRIREALDEYHDAQAALLPVLHVAQDQFGWLSGEAIDLVARRLALPRMHVVSVVSFYTMFHTQPVGRHHIQVCRTISCAMAGAPSIVRHIEEKLGIGPGEVTPDGRFSLEEVECLALCGSGPAMLVNKTEYENLSPQKVDAILDACK